MEMTATYWKANSIGKKFLSKTIKHQVKELAATHEEFIRFCSLCEMSLSQELRTSVFLFCHLLFNILPVPREVLQVTFYFESFVKIFFINSQLNNIKQLLNLRLLSKAWIRWMRLILFLELNSCRSGIRTLTTKLECDCGSLYPEHKVKKCKFGQG